MFIFAVFREETFEVLNLEETNIPTTYRYVRQRLTMLVTMFVHCEFVQTTLDCVLPVTFIPKLVRLQKMLYRLSNCLKKGP